MDILYRLIRSMTKEEVRHFKLSLKRIDSSDIRKDAQLFDTLRRQGEEEEDELVTRLYPGGDKNAYYRLKNRLTESLMANLALLHGQKTGESQIYRMLLLSRVFLSRQEYMLSVYCLKKAEKIGLRAEQFALLDQVYAGFIRLANEWAGLNPQIYIQRQEKNHPRAEAIRKLEQVMAMLHYRIMRSQHYGRQNRGVPDLINRTIREYADIREWNKSVTMQLTLFRAVSQLLVQKKEFAELRQFTEKTYAFFERKLWFDKSRLEDKIRMQIYLVNSCFMTADYPASLQYANWLKTTLEEQRRLYYSKYILFYYNALVNNYSVQDPRRALEVLQEMEQLSRGMKNRYYEHFVLINRATVLYQLRRFDEAIRSLVRCYVQEYYLQADAGFQLKVAVAELMMQHASGDYSITNQRCEQVRKQFNLPLSTSVHRPEKIMLDLIVNLCQIGLKKLSKNRINAVYALREELLKKEYRQGEQILNYADWCSCIPF